MSESFRQLLRALPDFGDILPHFDPATASPDPTVLFREWFDEALAEGIPQPHAFSLATATADAVVSSRMLILKDIDDGNWQFATSKLSRKGRELTANPNAAMNFYWSALGRQVRVCGAVHELSAEESAADWNARPATDGSVNAAWQLYALRPTEIEFWQASTDRHHVRHRYNL